MKIPRGYGQTFGTLGRLLLFRQISLRRLTVLPFNLLAWLLNRPPPFMPPVLQIDITNMCNLRCPGCLTGMGFHKNRPGMMPYEKFRSLIDEVGRSTAVAVLYNSGEPLFNPDALKMIRLLAENRIASVISTNGHFVKTKEAAEELAAAGLSVMIVSLSGATQKVYEQYHRGGSLDQVIRGVRHVRAARKNMGKKTPLIIFRILVMDHNRHETAAMASLAKKAGCDWFELREINWQARLIEKTAALSHNKEQTPDGGKIRHCLWPWLATVVNWDGNVYPCCFYNLDLPVMGKALDEGGIKAVWKGSAYNRFRKKMRAGTGYPDACRGCPAETGFQTRFSRQKRTVYLSTSQNPDNRA